MWSSILFKISCVAKLKKSFEYYWCPIIQIWVTLIANLLLMVVQNRLKRRWSFSGLATMVRLTLMYYVNLFSLLNNPEKDWLNLLEKASIFPPEPS